MRNTDRSSSWWLARQIMILPILAICLMVLLIHTTLIVPIDYDALSFIRFLSFEGQKLSGLLVEIIWWQSLFKSLINAVLYSLTEVALALILIRLIRDYLPLKKVRMTLLASVWLVPPEASNNLFEMLMTQTAWTISSEQVNYLATVWRNSGFVAFAIYPLWSKSLQEYNVVIRVYHLTFTRRIYLFLSQARHIFLATTFVLLIIHFDPVAQWMAQHKLLNDQTSNVSMTYMHHIATARSLTLIIELALFMLMLGYIRKAIR